jgi:hypothetical protein
MPVDSSINSNFISFVLSRVKVNSASRSDSDRSIIQSLSLEGLENVNGGAGTKFEDTNFIIQDSTL